MARVLTYSTLSHRIVAAAAAAAANYLNIPSLLSLVSAAVARRYAGSPPEVWRRVFGLPDDLSSSDLERIEREYEVRYRPPGHSREVPLCR